MSDQAMVAAETAAGRLAVFHDCRWLAPAITEAAPATPAIKANITKNPVAALPIGKYIGEKWAGRLKSAPWMFLQKQNV